VVVQQFRDAQVADLDGLVLREEDVQGFYVAVQDALAVDVLQTDQDLQEDLPDLVLL
jgi:hypothetical protein